MTSHPQGLRESFDRDAFSAGEFPNISHTTIVLIVERLDLLSGAIARSDILAPFRPIEMVTSGRFLSVMVLRNRPASQDLDYFLNANSFRKFYEPVRSHIEQLIRRVGQHLGYIGKWANDEIRLFLSLLDDPEDLFNNLSSKVLVAHFYHVEPFLNDNDETEGGSANDDDNNDGDGEGDDDDSDNGDEDKDDDDDDDDEDGETG
nr:hypothetical protein B0A51_00930 [Rachicladosporium sp. CCFEE 5018]